MTTYRYGDHERQRLDLYLPEGEARALIVWFHGGGIEGGNTTDYAEMATSLAAQDFAVSLPTYRMLGDAAHPACIEDAAAAVKASRDAVDAPILVGGSSAGAYLSMMLCFDRHYLCGVGMDRDDVRGWLFNAGQPTTHYNVLRYRGEDPRRVIIDDTAPLWYVTEDVPRAPMIILTADNDMPSRRTQNILFRETLLRYGMAESDVEMETLNGYTHCGYDWVREKNGKFVLENRLLRLAERLGA